MNYCEIMRLEREKRNLTQEEVARQIGMSGERYSKYERGDRKITVDILIGIANLYNISLDYLTGRYKNQ